jgi:hypothetical protein
MIIKLYEIFKSLSIYKWKIKFKIFFIFIIKIVKITPLSLGPVPLSIYDVAILMRKSHVIFVFLMNLFTSFLFPFLTRTLCRHSSTLILYFINCIDAHAHQSWSPKPADIDTCWGNKYSS